MRKFNKKQRNLILKYWMEDKLDYSNVELEENKEKLMEELEKINLYENMWSDLDRLIQDLNWSRNPRETIKQFI